jgi:uncharacterized membrane protein
MLLMTFLRYFFWATCIACFLVSLCFGERDEKRAMTIILLGSILTTLVALTMNHNFANITIWFLLVDLGVLVAFVKLLFDSQKYWPIWVGSLQLISVVIHLLDLLVPSTLPAAYAMLQGFWVYPMFFAIMMGTYGSRIAVRRKQANTIVSGGK